MGADQAKFFVTTLGQAMQGEWMHTYKAINAVPDAKKGEQLMLITTHADLDRKHLQEALRGKVSELMAPRHLMHVDELPLLGTGKTDYMTLGRMAREAVAK